MVRRISPEVVEKIHTLFKDGNLSPYEIARQTGVSYGLVYVETRLPKRVNPDTGRQFSSTREYGHYMARHRVRPGTKDYFESRTEYENFRANQRSQREQNIAFAELIKSKLNSLGKTQNWLAGEADTSKQLISLYVQAKSIPGKERFRKIISALKVETLPDCLESLIGS